MAGEFDMRPTYKFYGAVPPDILFAAKHGRATFRG
jgi:hypothetical protein